MGKKKRSPLIGQAQSISAQERGAGQENVNKGVSDVGAGIGLEKGAVTDPTSSPLYKALYNTEAGQMSRAYDAASSNTAAKARQAGFGYSQPVAEGAQTELRGREASAVGELPGKVASETVPMELQAGRDIMAGGRDIAGAGTSELMAGNEMFTAGAVPLEKQYQDYSLNYVPLWQRMAQGGAQGGLNAALAAA